MTRVISIGLDGAAWHKLDRMMTEGQLPNLQELSERGARAPLRTVHPPVTCPAWRCSTSGKNPGKLGVFWWLDFDRRTGSMSTPDARSFDTADVWDYLSDEGERCAVMNVPMTYPPTQLSGKMVSGFGAPFDLDEGDVTITYPSEFDSELREQYDWKIGIEDITTPEGRQTAYDVIRSRFELLLDLLEEDYDYLHLTVFYINMLQHKYSDGEETAEGWKIIDNYLGELMDEDAILLLYSDHGHSTIERTVAINRWLMEQGYLALESDASDRATQSLYSLLTKVGISPKRLAYLLRNTLPKSVYERLISSASLIPMSKLSERIDWAESDAVALSQGPLYINRDRLGSDYDAFRNSLKEELSSLSYRGELVLSDVYTTSEVYEGPYLDTGPDLMLVSNQGWEIYGGIVPSTFEAQASSWTSGNHPIGVLLCSGPGIIDDELPEKSILDVAPTILYALGCAIPNDIDGEPLVGLFENERTVNKREPIKQLERQDRSLDGELSERLEDLGYLE
jgi:predicted AlkP superfamily phosphohydrolase/phosphomutase